MIGEVDIGNSASESWVRFPELENVCVKSLNVFHCVELWVFFFIIILADFPKLDNLQRSSSGYLSFTDHTTCIF